MGEKIRVAILDDHQSIIDGYLYRLKEDPDIVVVGTAAYGDEIEPLLEQHSVDVLILDITLPMSANNSNPFHVHFGITKFTQKYNGLKILVISMHDTPRLIQSVVKAGASGFILKDDQRAIRDLSAIVRSIGNGGKYFSERAFRLLQPIKDEAISLSPRQIEALSLCAAYPDATLLEVAGMMDVAGPTVRNLLSKSYERMGVRTRGAAVARARYLGLIP